MKNFNQTLINGFAWEASTRLVVQVASWVSTIWVARLLSPEDYGIVAISGIFTGLCLMFSVMGLTNALINKEHIEEHDKANVFWASCANAVVVYGALYFFAPYIAAFYDSPELGSIVRVAGLMVVISPLSAVPRALLMRDLRFKSLALIAMVTNLLLTIMTLWLAFTGWGYWSLILSTVVAQFVELSILSFVAGYIPSLPRKIKTILPLYKYGISVLGARLLGYLNSSWPTIVASSQLGKIPTGHLNMANTLASLPMTKIGEIFSKIAFPAFSRIQSDQEKTKQLFLSMHRYLFMVIAPMFIGIAFVAPVLVPLLIGEKWLPVVMPLQIICFANVITGSGMLIPRVFEGLGNAAASFKYQVLVAVLTPCAMIIGLQWGLNGLLIGWALSGPISYIYLLKVLFRLTDMTAREFFNSVSVTLLCVSVMSLALFLADWFLVEMNLPLLFDLCIKVVVGGLSYCAAYLILGREYVAQIFVLVRNRGIVD